MLLRNFVTLLLVTTFQYGVSSPSTTPEPNECLRLIRKGGEIACNLTGEGNFKLFSRVNCWVTCSDGTNDFLLPHRLCDRYLDVSDWMTFQQAFGALPDFNYEMCDDEWRQKLERWQKDWESRYQKVKNSICTHKDHAF
uniref:Putative ixodes 10 kDa peptide protein n=1 Tax=Ixodes ricinus TaxID=34613 RepID=A0A0K8RHY8_IXORI